MGGFWVCVRGFDRAPGRFISFQAYQRTNRIQLGPCTPLWRRARREKKVEGLGIKPASQPSTQQRHNSMHTQAREHTQQSSVSTRASLPDSRAGTVRRTGPWQETGSIHWPLDRTLHSVVHMPPNCTECAPLCRACTTTQRQVNNAQVRQSPSVQPPGFPAAPIAARVNRHGPAIWGEFAVAVVPLTVCRHVRPDAQKGVLRPDASQGPAIGAGDPSVAPLLLCASGHISQYPCKRSTNITTRGLGRREQPVRHRLPARRVGEWGEGPGGPWDQR